MSPREAQKGRRIADASRELIESGELACGDKVPAGYCFSVARDTARAAG
jgi:DNA-binding GntR family transcriptional regulator